MIGRALALRAIAKQYYDDVADAYDELYQDPASRYEDDRVCALIAEWQLERARVLDLGCGTGALLDWGFRPHEYLGVDLSPRMVDVARRKWPRRAFMVDDIREFAFMDRTFSVVLALFGVPSFAVDTELDRLLLPLDPRGRFLLMPFAGRRDEVVLRCDRGEDGLDQAVPVRRWRRDSVLEALSGVATDVRVVGLNACLPLGRALHWSLRLRNRVLENLDPDRCELLLVSGRKRA